MIIESVLLLGCLGIFFGIVLGIISKKFMVEEKPIIEKIENALPGVNCGACGYPGCREFAVALSKGDAPIDGCKVATRETAKAIVGILNQDPPKPKEKEVAIIYCGGGKNETTPIADYKGVDSCRAATLLTPSTSCTYGCMGFGDCVEACTFGAITIKDNLPVIDKEKCTACGACVAACPKRLIRLVPHSKKYHIICSSNDPAPATMKSCKVGCIACGACVRACPHDAILIVDNHAIIDYQKCINCGTCIAVCPRKIIKMNE